MRREPRPGAPSRVGAPAASPRADEAPAAPWRAGGGPLSWRAAAVAAAVAALLALHVGLALTAAASRSNTFDEIAHLPAGFAYWTRGDFRLNPENGNLPQRLGALPLLGQDHRFPAAEGPAWQRSDVWSIGHRFFFELGNDLDAMLRSARAAMSLLGAATGVVVFLWSRRLYGVSAGFLSLGLLVLCPTFLAHGPMVTSDVAAALFFTLAAAATWALLHRVDPLRVVAAGLAFGGLALAKYSAPLLVPMALGLAALRLVRRAPLPVAGLGRRQDVRGRGRQAAVLAASFAASAAIGFVVLWSAYDFRFSAFAAPDPAARLAPGWTWVEARHAEAPGFVIETVLDARDAGLFPEAYLFGFSHSYLRAQSRSAFLAGDYGTEGWAWFFPYAFAVKTPLATFGVWLLALASAGAAWSRARREAPGAALRAVGSSLYRTAPLWILLLVYGAASVTSRLNIGHRHLLVLHPALYVLAGAALAGAGPRLGRRHALAAALVAGLALESFAVRPHYLAFFNALAGGPSQGYRHLVDSSLDWGQDLPGLRRWLDEHRGSAETPVYLSYFGTASPEHYGIEATLLPGFFLSPPAWPLEPLRGGLYCVSATMLQAVYLRDAPGPAWTAQLEQRFQETSRLAGELERARGDGFATQVLLARHGEDFWKRALRVHMNLRAARLFAALRQREPDAQVGHSILIYRLSDEEAQRAVDPSAPPPELREVDWGPRS